MIVKTTVVIDTHPRITRFQPKLLMVLSMQDLDRFCEVELMYIISFLFIVY